MANSSTLYLISTLLLTCNLYVNGCYTSIISFGDSLADTGNLKQIYKKSDAKTPHFLFPPYGETFFHKPTGRCSNGRLIIDFVAESLGLPLIPPYLGRDVNADVTKLGQGVNYAVAGATALDNSFLEERGVYNSRPNASLGFQLGWFKESLSSICSTVSEALACISGSNIVKFVWRQIVCRYGLPRTIVSDNGKQFANNPFKEWCTKLSICQNFTSVAHPQANGQTEVTNRTIVKGIKKRLDRTRGAWVDELQSVLWAYRTTVRSATGETPYSLVYGSEAMIPLEIMLVSPRVGGFRTDGNDEALRHNLDLVEERRENAALRQAAYKLLTENYYNKKVRGAACKVGDLVLRKNEASLQEKPGKLCPNWEGPYRVKVARRNGSYMLESLDGRAVPRTWNMRNLRKFHF